MKTKIRTSFFILLLIFFSFIINYLVASNGVYPVDTFIHFDHGFRILKGEVPIKDYWIVHGFLIDYLQAFFFKVFGSNWNSYLIHSSLINSIISLLSFVIFKNYLEINTSLSIFFSLMIAVLFYPISGTPFLDLHSSFFSLISFYLIIISIKNGNDKLWFFVPIFLLFAFLSKQVPASYTIISVIFFCVYFCYGEKNFKFFQILILGSLTSLLLLFVFLLYQKISLRDFIIQIFIFPQSIGETRYADYFLNFKNVVLDFKFIYISYFILVFFCFFKFKKKKFFFRSKDFYIFAILTLFTASCIFHQIYTKNQIYIFFLIPIICAFCFYYLNKIKFKYTYLTKILIVTFCFLVSLKYFQRFDLDRKFHELSNTNLKNGVDFQEFDQKFKNLSWISPHYDNAREELRFLKKFKTILKAENKNVMVITDYNFFSLTIGKSFFSPSRTYDDISYPSKGTKFFNEYKTFLINHILKNKIQLIYILEREEISNARLNHLLFNYISKNCFRSENIDKNITKITISQIKCDELKK